jgi:starch synthase
LHIKAFLQKLDRKFMPNQKILYITTEMYPYQEDTNMAAVVNKMALKMHQEGNDVRVFMPRFGQISERKFQLHEVIRLSGMNIIINDLDQPLIIKVASLPGKDFRFTLLTMKNTSKENNIILMMKEILSMIMTKELFSLQEE